MTDRLTPEHEAEIAMRDLIATKGPWGLYESGTMIDVAADLEETGCGYRARRGIARFEDEPLDNDPTHTEWTAEEDWEQVRIDAEFVAHAREDVPALLAELAAVRAERDQAQPRVAELEGLLECLASPDPCVWQGQVCLTHSWDSDIGLCPHGQAQALLGGAA